MWVLIFFAGYLLTIMRGIRGEILLTNGGYIMRTYKNIISWIVKYNRDYWLPYYNTQSMIVDEVCCKLYGYSWDSTWGGDEDELYEILNDRTKGYDMIIARHVMRNHKWDYNNYKELITNIANDIVKEFTIGA